MFIYSYLYNLPFQLSEIMFLQGAILYEIYVSLLLDTSLLSFHLSKGQNARAEVTLHLPRAPAISLFSLTCEVLYYVK